MDLRDLHSSLFLVLSSISRSHVYRHFKDTKSLIQPNLEKVFHIIYIYICFHIVCPRHACLPPLSTPSPALEVAGPCRCTQLPSLVALDLPSPRRSARLRTVASGGHDAVRAAARGGGGCGADEPRGEAFGGGGGEELGKGRTGGEKRCFRETRDALAVSSSASS